MATRTICQYRKISELEKNKEDWVCYIERIMLFFETTEIEEDSKRAPNTYAKQNC